MVRGVLVLVLGKGKLGVSLPGGAEEPSGFRYLRVLKLVVRG